MLLATSLRSTALLLSIVSTAVFLALPVAAVARPQRMDDPGTQYPEFAGDANHMPVNCVATPQELLAYARRLHVTRQAMSEFERRGYIARPELDAAANGCPEPRSFAALAYERPVTWLDSTHAVQPAILVVTIVNPVNGEPLTTVSAGLAVFDVERGTVFSGDSLDALEPSFDLAPRGGGGGRGVMPEDLADMRSLFDAYLRFAALARCMSEPAKPQCVRSPQDILPCFEWVYALTRCISAPTAPTPFPCEKGMLCLPVF